MSNPIIEQIILQVITTLGDITVANGYNQDVGTVHRPRTLQARNQATYQSLDMVLTLGETVENEDLSYSGNPPIVGITQELNLDIIYRPSKAATDAIETVLLRFEADVRKALMSDAQVSGLAIDSDMDTPEWWVNSDDGTVGATVKYNVHYRMFENDPYTST